MVNYVKLMTFYVFEVCLWSRFSIQFKKQTLHQLIFHSDNSVNKVIAAVISRRFSIQQNCQQNDEMFHIAASTCNEFLCAKYIFRSYFGYKRHPKPI